MRSICVAVSGGVGRLVRRAAGEGDIQPARALGVQPDRACTTAPSVSKRSPARKMVGMWLRTGLGELELGLSEARDRDQYGDEGADDGSPAAVASL